VEHTHNKYSLGLDKIEHDVATDFKSEQAWTNRFARSSYRRTSSQEIESVFQFGEIPVRLSPSPRNRGKGRDAIEIDLSFG
jgi:hypothetical protein